jgi:hypothetical protein
MLLTFTSDRQARQPGVCLYSASVQQAKSAADIEIHVSGNSQKVRFNCKKAEVLLIHQTDVINGYTKDLSLKQT